MGWTTWKENWHREGGGGEVMRLAWPLILSNSFIMLQLFLDRWMLSKYSTEALAAALPAALVFWTPFALFQNTALYSTTFVAQYLGAGRPQRVGPAVWQALYFAGGAGVAYLAFLPLGGPIMAAIGHSPRIQELEVAYFHCLCFCVLPTLVKDAISGFFIGRGDSWTVMVLNAVGLAVNAVLNYLLIFGNWGFPEWGIAGAGWATVAASVASGALALVLFFRAGHDAQFATRRGWRFEPDLFRRLLRFGLPNGLQWMIDGLAFSAFVFLIGRMGDAQLAATNVAVAVNILAFLPPMGIGQAVGVLVGQRLGEDRPQVAERSTWSGFWVAWLMMAAIASSFVVVPEAYLALFEPTSASEARIWSEVSALVPVLLYFVAVYCLFDSLNLVFSFALRGAGDTRFVTLIALLLSWSIMVVPTWLAWRFDWGLYWAWGFASAYVIALGFTFLLRFRHGKWKTMRVIEPLAIEEPTPAAEPAPAGEPQAECEPA
jgi:MATE family multidrug resistance protein